MEDQQQARRFINWLEQKWVGSRQCPVCAANAWSIGDIAELRGFHGGDLVVGGGPLYPLVPVTCNNCGNTLLFNALLSGVVEHEIPPDVGPADEADESSSDG